MLMPKKNQTQGRHGWKISLAWEFGQHGSTEGLGNIDTCVLRAVQVISPPGFNSQPKFQGGKRVAIAFSQRVSKNRRPVSLTRKLDHKLRGYATAASAAGVSLLALAQPSLAEIVYTPTHQTISPRGGTLALDLNNDGVTDFRIDNDLLVCGSRDRTPECSGYTFQSLLVFPYGSK